MSQTGSAICECGREHRAASRVLAGVGAIDGMGLAFKPGELAHARAMVVMDANTKGVAGDRVVAILEGLGAKAEVVVLSNPHDAHAPLEPDADQVFRVMEGILPDTRWLFSVGSGSITDLSRFVAYRMGIPHVAVATAASMDGYTSSVAPLIYRGFKRTYPSSAPAVVVADTELLANAPAQMTAAGFGDLVGKLTANSDWLVAHLGFGEYRCPMVWRMLDEAIRACSAGVEGLRRGEPAVVEALVKGLIDSGTAIMYVGNSRPASGAEHLLSHSWEMMSLCAGERPNLHGAQVGVATVLVAGLYERILALEPQEVAERAEGGSSVRDWVRDMEEAYGPHAASEAVRESGARDRSQAARALRLVQLAARWDDIRREVRAILPGPESIADLLRRGGAPATPQELGIPGDRVAKAFRTAHNLRNRYTALNLAEDLGVLEGYIEGCVWGS